jgi:hypothetical protein
MLRNVDIGQVGITVATNTALFTALDMSQWIADAFSLGTFPANAVAAVIATALALALNAAVRLIGFNA